MPTDNSPETPLGRLLREAREARGENAGDISRRLGTNPDGSPVFRANALNKLEREGTSLTLPTVQRLSRGYDLPEMLIWKKSGETVGVKPEPDTLPEVAVRLSAPRFERLSPKNVSLLVAIADAILGADQGSPNPA